MSIFKIVWTSSTYWFGVRGRRFFINFDAVSLMVTQSRICLFLVTLHLGWISFPSWSSRVAPPILLPRCPSNFPDFWMNLWWHPHCHSDGWGNITALYTVVLHCTALKCAALHCTTLYCAALPCTLLHYITLHCTVLHYTALHCNVLHYIALHYSSVLPRIRALHFTER